MNEDKKSHIERHRRRVVAVVEWENLAYFPPDRRGETGAFYKGCARLRSVRDAEDGSLIAYSLRINLTERQAGRLGKLTWGTRLTFSADVVDVGEVHLHLSNPRGYFRLPTPPAPPEARVLLAELQVRLDIRKQETAASDDEALEDEPCIPETAIHELGHAIIADATGGWVDMLIAASGEDRSGRKYMGQCRSYDVGDELTDLAAGFAAEHLEDEYVEPWMDQFEGDYLDFGEELLDQKIRAALSRVAEGEAQTVIDAAIDAVIPPSDEEIEAAWVAAVDRATLILLEHRPLFDLTMAALELSRYLWHGKLKQLGFARYLSSEERSQSTERELQNRLAQAKRLGRFRQVKLPS